MSHKIDMINGGIVKKLIVFTIPIMLQGLLQSIYNAADLVIVGQYSGDAALSSVGATTSIYNVMVALFMGVSVGVDFVTSFYYGRRDVDKVKKGIDTAIIVALILGAIATALGLCITEPVLKLMNTPTEHGVLNGAVIYLKILMIGVPFSILFNFCAAIFRTSGDTNRPFIYLVISGATNVALNFIFVAGFNLGVVGVAVATVISQVLSCMLIFIKLLTNKGLFSFSLKNIQFSWNLFGKMIAVGIPAGLQSCAFSLSNSFLQSGVNTFGKDAMAGSTAIATVEGLMWVTITSFNNTTTTFVSQNLGAGKLDRARKSFSYSLLMTGAIGIVIGLSAYFLADPIISIFIKDNPIAFDYARERMSVTFPLYFLAGIMGVLPGAIRGLGSSLPPSLITIFGTCGIRIIWVYTVFKAFPSLNVLYLVHPITWVLTITALLITLKIVYARTKERLDSAKKRIYVRKSRSTV